MLLPHACVLAAGMVRVRSIIIAMSVSLNVATKVQMLCTSGLWTTPCFHIIVCDLVRGIGNNNVGAVLNKQ